MSASDIDEAAAKFTKAFGPQNNRRAQGASVLAVAAKLLYEDALGDEEGKAMEEHCFSTEEGGWAAHLCGKRVPPEYSAIVNDLVLVASHTLPAPFSMSPLKRDGVCFCVRDSKDAVAVHPEGLRAAAKALTGVERAWSVSQAKEFVEQESEFGVWVKQKRVVLYYLDEADGEVKKRAAKQSGGVLLLFLAKLPEVVIGHVRNAVADSPPLLPFREVASAGDQQVEAGEGEVGGGDQQVAADEEKAPAVQGGGRQQLLAALNVACVKGGLPSGQPPGAQ